MGYLGTLLGASPETGRPAARIATRWQAWRYRIEDIADPTAVTITIARRGGPARGTHASK